jgi:hypothetical protein
LRAPAATLPRSQAYPLFTMSIMPIDPWA